MRSAACDACYRAARAQSTAERQQARSGPREGPAWLPTPPPGAYAQITAWTSREDWLTALVAALDTPEGEQVRAEVSVARQTLLEVAALDAEAADSATGRSVATAHATVARRLGRAAKTVQRARAVIAGLGFSVTVVAGRYMTNEERAEASTGQLRFANLQALTTPTHWRHVRARTSNVHLPPRGSSTPHRDSRRNSPMRASARKNGAPRRARTTRHRADHQRPPLAIQRFAADLARMHPALAAGHHIGVLCRALHESLELDPADWTPRGLLAAIDLRNQQAARDSILYALAHNPLGLFLHQARDTMATTEGNLARQRREAQERLAEAERRARQRAWDAHILLDQRGNLHGPGHTKVRETLTVADAERETAPPHDIRAADPGVESRQSSDAGEPGGTVPRSPNHAS